MAVISNSDKKDTTDNVAASRSNISLRCGDCLHHKGSTPHPAIGQRCADRGVKTYAAAPSCYTANVNVFRKIAPETLTVLGSIISHFSPQQSRILMGLLKGAGSLEKHNLSFLEKVFFKLGEDYLDSYYSGFVLGCGVNQNLMLVGSTFFTGVRNPVIAHLDVDSILTAKAFAKKKKQLLAAGKLYVPRKPHRNDVTADNYTPPSIETCKAELEALANKGKKKRRSSNEEARGVLEINLSEHRSGYGRSKSSDDL